MEMTRGLAALAALAALGAAANARATPAGLSAAAARPLVADGRTGVPIAVRGAPGPLEGERADLPALPIVRCEGAAALPARPGHPPVVLPPARPSGYTLACTVEARGAVARFALPVAAPPPGLYLEVAPAHVAGGGAVIQVRPFLIEREAVRRPTGVRLAASVGTLAPAAGGWTLTLPPGAAPRTVAIVAWAEGHAAAAFVPVAGHVEVPVRTKGAASVTVRLPGGSFGPVLVKRDRVTVPVVVPPGVGRAVARATDARGEAREEIVDLHPPPLARIAALGASDAAADGSGRVLVAVSAEDGGPAPAGLRLRARAERGRAGAALARGPGLWEVPYAAPASLGPDRVVVTVPGVGEAAASLAVVPASPAEIRVAVPTQALGPGAAWHASIIVRDGARNVVRTVTPTATLDGRPLAVTPAGPGWMVAATAPVRVPPSGAVILEVRAGEARAREILPIRAAPAASASLTVAAAGRTAELNVRARDRHGNAVPASGFELRVDGARPGPARPAGDDVRVALAAEPDARAADVEVVAGGRTLARARVRFAPPLHALVLGGWAGGGLLTGLGDLTTARAAAGLGLRRGIGRFELTLTAGVEGYLWSDTVQVAAGGAALAVDRSLKVLGVPLALRARLPLRPWLGVAAAAAFVPTFVRGTSDPRLQSPERFGRTLPGARLGLAGDVAVGPGRAVLGVSYGWARLSDTPITGNVDGLFVGLSYELWLVDLGL
ncbi:MAG TPA: hypothetical protein VGQ83_01840 [Polyangia bacterium]|jgi:hypothetical protein